MFFSQQRRHLLRNNFDICYNKIGCFDAFSKTLLVLARSQQWHQANHRSFKLVQLLLLLPIKRRQYVFIGGDLNVHFKSIKCLFSHWKRRLRATYISTRARIDGKNQGFAGWQLQRCQNDVSLMATAGEGKNRRHQIDRTKHDFVKCIVTLYNKAQW